MTPTVHPASRPATDYDWRTDAACVGMDVNTFFPNSTQYAQIERAKAICSRCPSKNPCLEDALRPGRITEGIWGGLTDAERDSLKRKRRRTA